MIREGFAIETRERRYRGPAKARLSFAEDERIWAVEDWTNKDRNSWKGWISGWSGSL